MQIKSARFFVYVTELDRSLQFYRHVLGMQAVDRIVGGQVLAAGSVEIELMQERRDTEEPVERSTGLVLIVASADAAYEELLDQQVPVLAEIGPTPEGGRIFFVADPDGLPIAIMSEPPESPPIEWLLGDQ